jgi:hypothetical protein
VICRETSDPAIMHESDVPTREMSANRSRRQDAQLVVLAMLTLIGGWLRFQAIGFGLPDKFRPDEEYVVSRALGFEKDWNPHFAIYPAAQMYVQHAALWTYATLNGQGAHFRDAYAGDSQALAYLIARGTSALFGTASVPAIYFASRSAFGGGAALVAAAILSCAILPVQESKYATSDAAAVFWLIVAIAMVLRVAAKGRDRDYLGAGLFTGIAAATKYPAIALLFGIAASHLEARRRERHSLWFCFWDIRLLILVCALLLGFLGSTPYFLTDWTQTVNDYRYQQGFVLYGVGNPQASSGLPWLMLYALPDGFGIPLEIVFTLSLVWAAMSKKLGALSLLAFVAISLIGLNFSHYVFYRYLLIPMGAMIILAGAFMDSLVARLSHHVGRHVAMPIAVITLAIVLTPLLKEDLSLNRLLSRADTRTLARVWITRHIAPGSTIAATQSTTLYGKPQLPNDYKIAQFENIRALRAKDIHWVMSDSLAPLAYYSTGPSSVELAELDSQAELVLDIDPIRSGMPAPVFDGADAFYAPLQNASSMSRPGPRIRVWHVK